MIAQLDTSGVLEANPGGQAAFATDWEHRFIALEGGWGSGKTWIGARKLVTLHIHNAFDPDGDATYVPSAVIGPAYRNAMDVDVPEIEAACEEVGLKCVFESSKLQIVIPELGTRRKPSIIMVRTAEAPDKITGWQVGAVWGDEAARWHEDRFDPKRDAYLQVTGRIRHPSANFLQLMLTYTNEGDATRVYEEFHAGHPDHALYRASTKENAVMQEFYDMQAGLLTAELKEQYLEGGAISLRGAKVYPVFDANVHVDDSVELVKDRVLHMAVDFNISPGMHAEIGQYCEERDELIVVHELHASRMDVRALVRALRDLIAQLGGWQWPELQVFGDATGRSEWAGTAQSCYEVLREGLDNLNVPYRVRVPKVNPHVDDRVNAINVAMLDLKGNVHWKCHSRCARLIDDLRKMKRDEFGEIDKRDRRLSHASEAEGYRVSYLRPARVVARTVGGRFSVTV